MADPVAVIIAEIEPDAGFWHASTRDAFEAAACTLIGEGWSEERVTDFLGDLVTAMQGEYGE